VNVIFQREKEQKMKARSGFTLVEILIVVVILGILAAIVIPQFTDASTEAKTSSLMTDLQTMRSQIELYKIQHNDGLPGVDNTASGGSHTGGAGLVAALTGQTNIAGEVGTDYGPYVQQIPSNQFVDSNVIATGTAATPPIVSDGSVGWYFNTDTGAFHACDTAAHADL
jgi:general secretion pathway protein G